MSYAPVDTKGAVALLPKDARDMLIAASKVVPIFFRPAAIDEAVANIKLKYPKFFQAEKFIP